jgi:glycosyltransferase involved in cell wall biosynthesis
MTAGASQTLVTIAIPTYRRPDLLRRALDSVAQQTYKALEVLVADNATEGGEVEAVVASFSSQLPGLVFHKHVANIGAVGNFFYCLERARGGYFMWLADDDEISPSAVEAMVQVLDRDPLAVSAVPHWLLKRGAIGGELQAARSYESLNRLSRVFRFVWRADDAFFYALHRVTVLRRARRVGYLWPNREILANWVYPYLLDLVLAGKIVNVERSDALWINHEYTEKSYERPSEGLSTHLRHVARRINVHAIYVTKVAAAMGLAAALLVAAVACTSLASEFAAKAATKLRRGFVPGGKLPVDRGAG